MGNKQKSKQYEYNGFGLATIQTNFDFYYNNETIEGVVHLNLTQAFNTKNLKILFVGKEWTHWYESNGKTEWKVSYKDKIHTTEMDIWTNQEEIL